MLIATGHIRWGILAAFLLVVGTLAYVAYAMTWPGELRGGSVPGLLFGTAAAVIMLFEGALWLRKYFPRMRLGKVSTWLKAHIWLGLLTLPLVFYHSAFRFGGLLEQLTMATFLVVFASGVFGLALQNVLPWLMSTELPNEVMYDELPRVARSFTERADKLVGQRTGIDPTLPADVPQDGERGSHNESPLATFYLGRLRPFLEGSPSAAARRSERQQMVRSFSHLRLLADESDHALLDELFVLFTESYRLRLQRQYFGWLHGWLSFHVPLTLALFVFLAAHIATALYY